jgi:hypothetical protein
MGHRAEQFIHACQVIECVRQHLAKAIRHMALPCRRRDYSAHHSPSSAIELSDIPDHHKV